MNEGQTVEHRGNVLPERPFLFNFPHGLILTCYIAVNFYKVSRCQKLPIIEYFTPINSSEILNSLFLVCFYYPNLPVGFLTNSNSFEIK